MKLVLQKKEYRIRLVVFSFSLFVALMLYQTDFMNLGTITAAGTLFLTIGTYFLQGKGLRGRIVFNKPVIFLVLFLLYSVMLTEFKGVRPNGYLRYIAQIAMCLLLFSVNLNPREHNYLKTVFIAASVMYAVLIIRSYTVNYREGYYHSNVILFNTELDPNFVGFPLVATSVLLLDNILRNHHRIVSTICYVIVAGTIVYTASRGSTVSLVCANMLVYILFLFQRNISVRKRILYILLPLLGVVFLVQLFSLLFPTEWERITTYGENADNGRFELWLLAILSWWEAPFFGRGLGYMYAFHHRAAHNTYLQILCETGFVGLILSGAFMILMLKKALKADKVIFCVLSGVLVQIMFLDALDNRCLWIVLSWIAMLPNRGKDTKRNDAYVQTPATKIQEEKINGLR